MTQQTTYSPEVQQLFTLGRPNAWPELRKNREDMPVDEYVNRFGFCQEHVPELLGVVRTWALPQSEETFDEVFGYAPVHAWRALGELRAAEAVDPLLELLPAFDETGDDWYIEELPSVFGLIGPPAVLALRIYINDRAESAFNRDIAGRGLEKIAIRNPEFRGEVVETLAGILDRREEDPWEVYGFLVGILTDMKAVEAAESIERAFSEDLVAEDICGDWTYVKEELGVEGLGLPMPERPARMLGPMGHFHIGQIGGPTYPETASDLRKKKKRRDKAKAKRKQKAKAAERNHRRAK